LFAPRFLGIDDQQRDILSYLRGEVPAELGTFSDSQLDAAARLLRALHDATSSSPLRGIHEVVCHGDASPCNAVFLDGMPYAWIDFDSAHPGSRSDDLGYAAWLWLDIGKDDFRAETQARRLARFFAVYGAASHVDRSQSIIEAQEKLCRRAGVHQDWLITVGSGH
jgi:aminoglycoside phosphotransferase (APT) family kinase protein